MMALGAIQAQLQRPEKQEKIYVTSYDNLDAAQGSHSCRHNAMQQSNRTLT